jgi:uncharacterized protein YggE
MRQLVVLICLASVCVPRLHSQSSSSDVKFVSDTLIVQADGTFESDPDVALLAFDVATQEKELKQAYAKASQAMRTIVDVATKNGLAKDAVHTGTLTIVPLYENYRSQKIRAYRVKGDVILKVEDFSKIGALMDDSIQEGIVDFRSLTYALSNEEAAKKKAVADAMQRAQGRAAVALEQSKQKLGPARFVNLEVSNVSGIAQMQRMLLVEATEQDSAGWGFGAKKKAPPPAPLPPPVNPEKITVKATIQAVFQIEK